MTMWLYFTSCKAPRRHEAAKNTPPGVNQSSAGTFHRAWMQSQTLASPRHPPDDWVPAATRLQQGRRVGQRRVGPTCLAADGFVDGALRAGHASAGRPLGRRLPVDQPVEKKKKKKNTITIEALYVYKCFQYSPSQARGG